MYPIKTEEEYALEIAKAKYETMGWDKELMPEWEFELDKTGTKLVRKGEIANP